MLADKFTHHLVKVHKTYKFFNIKKIRLILGLGR